MVSSIGMRPITGTAAKRSMARSLSLFSSPIIDDATSFEFREVRSAFTVKRV